MERGGATRQGHEAAGATIINTGIGWHEARVPTTPPACRAPHGRGSRRSSKPEVGIPGLITTNRINVPEVAEQVLADGCADMVSMARPVPPPTLNSSTRRRKGRRDEINVCIGCNQACLDHIFAQKCRADCGQSACVQRTELVYRPTPKRRKFAVVGAGQPASLPPPCWANMRSICSRRPTRSAASSTWRRAFRAKKSFTRCSVLPAEVTGVNVHPHPCHWSPAIWMKCSRHRCDAA